MVGGAEDEGMSDLEALSREELIEVILDLRGQIEVLMPEVALLRSILDEKGVAVPEGTAPARQVPSFVKPNRPRKDDGEEKGKRKKRSQGFARRCEEPTETVRHSVEKCPDCGRQLPPGTPHSSREIITIPQVRYRVVQHVMMRHRCGVCDKEWLAKPDLSQEVVGQSRFGIELTSLVAHLATEARMPHRTIQSLLQAEYGLHVAEGSITNMLHRVAACGKGWVKEILSTVRGAVFVHADETGWRENGRNGYLWSVSTPNCRYFHLGPSRGSAVIQELLGEEYSGIVVADFYVGYTPLGCLKQRCWVHLLRDVKALRDSHPEDRSLRKWFEKIRKLYESAKAYRARELAALEKDRREGREALNPLGRASQRRAEAREQFEKALMVLAEPYCGQEDPRRKLAERMERFLSELFLFVECPEVPPENNAAERAIRGAVIARKISGGTRSAKGSETKASLLTMWGTWTVRGLDALDACRRLLAGKPPPTPTSPLPAPT